MIQVATTLKAESRGPSPSPPLARPRPRILVIDDDDAIRRLIAFLLAPEGYELRTAASAEQGLDSIAAYRPDLVLVDMHLPSRSGFDVITDLRSRPETRLTPVVMITGDATPAGKLRAIESGVTDFLAKPFSPEELIARVRALLDLKAATDALESAEDVLISLARIIDARDPSTYGHSSRVSRSAVLLGERIGLEADALRTLERGGLVHDIGKIAVRDSILRKPGPLDADEIAEIRSHPVRGRDLLINMKTFAATIPIVYHHHERMDGSGYPDGLQGEEIPLLARITTIADVFDALSMARVYRPPLDRENALGIMGDEVRRGWWDAALFGEFRAVLESIPEPKGRPLAAVSRSERPGASSSTTSVPRDELAWLL